MQTRARIAELARSADAKYHAGDYPGAASDYRSALALAEQPDALEILELSSLLNNFAVVLKYMRGFAEAAAVYRRALVLTDQARGPAQPDVATLYHTLGGM